MVNQIEKLKCTGCMACGDVCPKQAISFKDDEEGFWYPNIDMEKCINCGLCDKVCPAINKTVEESLPRDNKPLTLEVKNLNDEIRLSSTSGGVYFALAEYILNKGGSIAGCVYNDDWSGSHHEVASTFEGLKRIYGSKYFQSNTSGIYKDVKELLQKGTEVFFCGAPCQVAGLYSYLKKDYQNLYTADFICRGINSPKAYRAYMDELQKKYKSSIKKVHFKNKTQGWANLGTRVEFENGKTYFRNRHTDPWVNGFINGNLYMRPSCTQCEYKKLPRLADISFGDFWGLNFSKEDEFKGVSVVFVNSEKGKQFFDACKEKFSVNERPLEVALKGNPAILNTIPMGKRRKEFFENIYKEPFSKLVWRLIGWSTPKWQVRYALILLKKYIKRNRK